MSNLIFVAFCVIAVTFMIVYVSVKLGSIEAMNKYFKSNGALADWKAFIGIALVIMFGLTFLTTPRAEELTILNYAEVTLGVDYVYNDERSSSCYSTGVNDRLTGNGTVAQNIVTFYDVDLNLQYQHHSCAINRDDHTYDAIGVVVTKRWYW